MGIRGLEHVTVDRRSNGSTLGKEKVKAFEVFLKQAFPASEIVYADIFWRHFRHLSTMENTIEIVTPEGDHTQTIKFLRDCATAPDQKSPKSCSIVKHRTAVPYLKLSQKRDRSFQLQCCVNRLVLIFRSLSGFDMWSVSDPYERKEIQLDGTRESVKEILGIIRTESELISPGRIIFGRIGQGCATAIHVLMCSGMRLGGFNGLSGWLPFKPRSSAKPGNDAWTVDDNGLHCSRKLLDSSNDEIDIGTLDIASSTGTSTFPSHSG